MNLWPFLTIFISLILILFFRRIDKRTINFNKFRRYAEKLSSDFNEFLIQKKAEFSESLVDLDVALKKSNQLLAKIDMADQSLKSGLISIKDEKNQLNAIKDELEKLKILKGEITAEIEKIETEIPPLKKLAKRVKRIGIDVALNEKVLNETVKKIPSINKQVQDKTEEVLEDLRDTILEETRGEFIPIIDEYRGNLELLRSAHNEELERFIDESQKITGHVIQKMTEMDGSLESLSTQLSRVESENLVQIEGRLKELEGAVGATKQKMEYAEKESIKLFLKRAEEEYKNYLHQLENSKALMKNDIFQQIESRAKDLSSYVIRLEGRVQTALSAIKDETNKYAEVLHLKVKAQESEADVLKKQIISEINEEANKNLILIKPIVSELNEKITNYKKEFAGIFKHIKNEFQFHKEAIDKEILSFAKDIEQKKKNIFEQLETRIQETAKQLSEINVRMENGIQNASASVRERFVHKLREYEGTITSLDGKIGDLKIIADTGQKMIEDRIESVFQNYKPNIEEKIHSLQSASEKLFAAEREKVIQKIDSIAQATNSELSKREEELNVYLKSVDATIKESEDNLKKQGEVLQENVNIVRIEARNELVTELENLKSIFRDEKQRVIEKYNKDLAGLHETLQSVNDKAEYIRRTVDQKVDETLRAVEENYKEIKANSMKTGDELIEAMRERVDGIGEEIERVRMVAVDLKDEILVDVNETFDIFKVDMEEEMARHRNRVTELETREEKVNNFLMKVEEDLNRTDEKFQSQESELAENAENFRIEMQETLSDELERFGMDRKKSMEKLEEELKGLGYKIEGMHERVEDIQRVVDQKVEEALGAVEENVRGIEKSYLKTGDEMIGKTKGNLEKVKGEIARIKEMAEGLKGEVVADINESLDRFRRDVEEEFVGHRNALTEIETREDKIKIFLERVEENIRLSELSLKEQEERIMGIFNESKDQSQTDLLNELESMREVFRAEKEKSMEKLEEELKGLGYKIEGMHERVEDIQRVVDQKVEEALGAVEENVRGIEKSYLKTGDEMIGKTKGNLEKVKGEIARIKEMAEGLKGEVVADINESLDRFRRDVEEEFVGHRNTVEDKKQEIMELVQSVTEETKTEMERSQSEARMLLKNFEEEVGSVQNRIESRVSDIERRIAEFEKESSVIKRAVKYKEQVQENIDRLSEILNQLKQDKKDIMSLKKVMDNIKKDEGDISAKVRLLKGEKKTVADIAKNAESAIGLISVVEEKIRFIEDEKELVDRVGETIKKMSGQVTGLEKKVNEMKSKEADLEISIETITKTKEFVGNLEQRADIIKESFHEIKGIQEDIQKRITLIDQRTNALKADENRIDEVLTKFKEMDALVTDIETRTQQLQSTREWIARTESRLTGLSNDAERIIGELKNLIDRSQLMNIAVAEAKTPKSKSPAQSREAESKVKTVLTLFDQKWTIPEICKVTKMSRGEVELILELNNR